MSKQYVAVIDFWSQCSSDYQAVKNIRTKIFSGEATLQQVMDWPDTFKGLGQGDLVITLAEGEDNE